MNYAIKFAGVGGQGIQLAGKLLGEAAYRQGLNVSQGVVYEPSTSGGLTVADITIAPRNEEIVYPFIERPDVLVVFAQRAWDEFKDMVTEDTVVIADYENVRCEGPEIERVKKAFHLKFSTMARELGSEKVTNVIVIGFIAEMLDMGDHHLSELIKASHPEDAEEYELLEVDPHNFEDSLIKASPERFRELNLKAFKMGYELSQSLDYTKEGIIHT